MKKINSSNLGDEVNKSYGHCERIAKQSGFCNNWTQKQVQHGKSAFTLAEVLVTLGIIGIVAATTMPTLIGNYQKQAYVTQLHKVYNETNQAIKQIMTDKNVDNLVEAGLTTQANTNAWVKKYFKVETDCSGDSTGCMAPNNEYVKIKKATNFMTERTGQNFYRLPSGAVIRPFSSVEGSKVLNILVDTNGKKGPNILGRDTFFMAVYNDGRIDDFKNAATPAPLSVADRNTLFSGQCNAENDSLWGCFGKIMNDGWQMKY